jgi:hypothetical protein
MDEFSCWTEKIPLDDFDAGKSTLLTQLCETKQSTKMKFYRNVHSPRNNSDLWKDT